MQWDAADCFYIVLLMTRAESSWKLSVSVMPCFPDVQTSSLKRILARRVRLPPFLWTSSGVAEICGTLVCSMSTVADMAKYPQYHFICKCTPSIAPVDGTAWQLFSSIVSGLSTMAIKSEGGMASRSSKPPASII